MDLFVTDKSIRATKQTEENPYDLESWSFLIRDAQARKVDEARATYERLLLAFPCSGRFWKLYVEHEMRSRNYDKVEKLFQRCLMKVLNIDLWKLYLAYVKETKAALPTYKEKMAQAYDFALDKIGMDYQSYSVWNEYVLFLKGVEAVGSYAENQKISAIRKVYQRGILVPMNNIEQFWKDYIHFEQGINPIIADKMGSEHSRDYMNARRVSKEMEVEMRGINRSLPSIPPTGLPEEHKQIDLWKKYIDWEKKNPLRTEDYTLLTRRVMYAFEQALLCLGHHPDVWYEAALFLQESSKILTEKGDVNAAKTFSDEAANVYERATGGVLKKNMLLYFAYADFEESRMKYEKVHQIYSRYLEIKDTDPTLTYVQYMKFARRAEGIKSARQIFKKAREDERSKYHVYISAALMEYYCSKDKNIAFKIFELGLKKYGDDPNYVLAYINYLSHLNEDNNTRVLFERVLTSGSLKHKDSAEIWNRFLEFECNIGDLTSIVKVEKRRSAVLQQLEQFEGKETAQLVDRYKFLDLFPCSTAELRAIGYQMMLRRSTANPAASSGYTAAADPDTERKLPVPDFSQMIPFKPKIKYVPGEYPIPGGGFPPPPTAASLCQMMPPPRCFHGPFVEVDTIMNIFSDFKLVEPEMGSAVVNGHDPKLFDLAKSVHWVVQPEQERRKRKAATGEDSDEDDTNPPPPVNDIYRARQQKRVK